MHIMHHKSYIKYPYLTADFKTALKQSFPLTPIRLQLHSQLS